MGSIYIDHNTILNKSSQLISGNNSIHIFIRHILP